MGRYRLLPGSCSGSLGEKLAPALGPDLALDELAAVRRLEMKAASAMLAALGCALVPGVGLAELLEGEGRTGCNADRDRQADGRDAEKGATREPVLRSMTGPLSACRTR